MTPTIESLVVRVPPGMKIPEVQRWVRANFPTLEPSNPDQRHGGKGTMRLVFSKKEEEKR